MAGEITISKLTLWKIISAILLVALVAAVFTGGFGIAGNDCPTQPTGNAQANPQQPPQQQFEKPTVDDDEVIGGKNAKVTMICFSDYQCPYCGKLEQGAIKQIKKEYIDTGKIKYAFRDFPLSFHPFAEKAAIAAYCAKEQGKFWEYHEKVFENSASLSDAKLKELAEELELDTSKFESCLASDKAKAEVQKDFSDGQKAGVTGTPTCFINGQKIVGAQPFENFKAIIDPLLE